MKRVSERLCKQVDSIGDYGALDTPSTSKTFKSDEEVDCCRLSNSLSLPHTQDAIANAVLGMATKSIQNKGTAEVELTHSATKPSSQHSQKQTLRRALASG